ncbi:MAG: class I SAM-dependent methyltransferase [Succinivibrionaceae bacterium]|nr:class I SAM-dependent methyltransferase [Succinivibrionaceae bacterium]
MTFSFPYARVFLNEGRERASLRHHPWVFSQAIARTEGEPHSGDPVTLLDAAGNFLGYGIYSEKSQIRVRLLSFREEERLEDGLIASRVARAVMAREPLRARGNDGLRLIASEGDFLPGLIVDQYNQYLVVSYSSHAMEAFRKPITAALSELFPDSPIYERSDARSRLKEGLPVRNGPVRGDPPPELIYVRENQEILLPVEIRGGHKTGTYLDQRENRRLASTLARGAKVLNCFSYTGGFGLWCLLGGARMVHNVDISGPVLQVAKAAVAHNHLDPGHCRFIKDDVFEYLRTAREQGESYDLVILDPPKFAESAAHLKSACRGYQDINRLALSLVRPGGTLLTFSCSGLISPELFQKIVADAALEAGVDGRFTRALRQDEDHPVALPCPEGLYLKGFEVTVG